MLAVFVIGFGCGAPVKAETPGLSWLMRKLDMAPAPARKRARSASDKKSDMPPLPARKPSHASKPTPPPSPNQAADRRGAGGGDNPPTPPARKPPIAENRPPQPENRAPLPPPPDRKPTDEDADDTARAQQAAPPPLPLRNPIAKLNPRRAEPEFNEGPVKRGKEPHEDFAGPQDRRQVTEETKVDGRQPASAKARAAERRKVVSDPGSGETVLQKTPPTRVEQARLRRDRERREQEEVERAERELAERQRLEFEQAEGERVARERAQQARAEAEQSGPDRPGSWGWTDKDVALAKERCALLLANTAISYKIQPPLRQGGCGSPAPILVSSIGSNPAVQISPPALINCAVASGLDRWIKTAVQPNAATYLGSPVVRFQNAASYACRGRNGAHSGKLSEHAFTNALDVAAFETKSGRTVTVLTQWPKRFLTRAPAYGPLKRGVIAAATTSELPNDGNAAFLVSTHHAACGIFGTVLGPAADAAHRSHFHLDMAKRRRSAFCE